MSQSEIGEVINIDYQSEQHDSDPHVSEQHICETQKNQHQNSSKNIVEDQRSSAEFYEEELEELEELEKEILYQEQNFKIVKQSDNVGEIQYGINQETQTEINIQSKHSVETYDKIMQVYPIQLLVLLITHTTHMLEFHQFIFNTGCQFDSFTSYFMNSFVDYHLQVAVLRIMLQADSIFTKQITLTDLLCHIFAAVLVSFTSKQYANIYKLLYILTIICDELQKMKFFKLSLLNHNSILPYVASFVGRPLFRIVMCNHFGIRLQFDSSTFILQCISTGFIYVAQKITNKINIVEWTTITLSLLVELLNALNVNMFFWVRYFKQLFFTSF